MLRAEEGVCRFFRRLEIPDSLGECHYVWVRPAQQGCEFIQRGPNRVERDLQAAFEKRCRDRAAGLLHFRSCGLEQTSLRTRPIVLGPTQVHFSQRDGGLCHA